jgi:hypothetical protein
LPNPLDAQARQFAAEQSSLLNRTITHGIRLSAVVTSTKVAPPALVVGRAVTKHNFVPAFIPVTTGRKAPCVYLMVAYILELDPEGVHIAVSKSQYGLYADESGESLLAHWDYERDPDHRYPSAHFQVQAESHGFNRVMAHSREVLGRDSPGRPLRDLHFPVGGRRFRPTLEDVIEFLIVEELVDRHIGWEDAIEERRSDWEARQLGAAVRRNPEIAKAALRELNDGADPAS